MMSNALSVPADACSPDADRDRTGASTRLPDWLVHLVALVIRFLLGHTRAGHSRRALTPPSSRNDRPALPAGSVQQRAASRPGVFGNAVASMRLRRGSGHGRPNWPELRCAILSFRNSVKGVRPGLPAGSLRWFENSHVVPGAIAGIAKAPAAKTMASLLSRHAAASPPSSDLVSQAVPAGTSIPCRLRPASGPDAHRDGSVNQPVPVPGHQHRYCN